MPVKASVKFSFKTPKLDFTGTMSEIAEKIIIPDMRLGINRSIGIDNQPLPALEPSTIAAKSAARKDAKKTGGLKVAGLAGARGGSQQLVDTGRLRDSFQHEVVKTNHVRISLAADRAEIGYYLQAVGVGKKKKKFNFFGISQRAEFQAVSKMKQAVAGVLKNGR